MPLTVRKATAADAAALAALRWPDQRGPSGAFAESFTAWIGDHPSTHLPFLAEVDTDAVGAAWLMIAERVPSPTQPLRRFGDVQSVFVVPDRRNSGIGAALMAAVLAEAAALELEHVTVHSSGRAVPFYLRAGFEHHQHWLRWKPAPAGNLDHGDPVGQEAAR
jgi:GNAT superfamily N-acetyltransferase